MGIGDWDCQYPAGAKTFYILMRQLADLLNDSRLDNGQRRSG